jgi:hypothetical protein
LIVGCRCFFTCGSCCRRCCCRFGLSFISGLGAVGVDVVVAGLGCFVVFDLIFILAFVLFDVDGLCVAVGGCSCNFLTLGSLHFAVVVVVVVSDVSDVFDVSCSMYVCSLSGFPLVLVLVVRGVVCSLHVVVDGCCSLLLQGVEVPVLLVSLVSIVSFGNVVVGVSVGRVLLCLACLLPVSLGRLSWCGVVWSRVPWCSVPWCRVPGCWVARCRVSCCRVSGPLLWPLYSVVVAEVPNFSAEVACSCSLLLGPLQVAVAAVAEGSGEVEGLSWR